MDPKANTPETPANPAPAAPAAPAPAAATSVPPAAAASAATGVAYSGFWRRFVAVLIDGIIIGIVMSALSALIPSLKSADLGSQYSTVQFILLTAYSVVLLSLWQATVGKKVMGVIVTAEDGSKAPVGKLVVRELMKLVSAAILLIGYLMMLWDPRKQTLHDKAAGTVVVKN